MHRFFVSPNAIQRGRVLIQGQQAHHIRNVLRMTPGEHIIVLDDSGWEMEVELTEVEPYQISGNIIRRMLARGEPRVKVSLYQAMLKGDRFEFTLQKGTELGIVEFVPIITSRCVVANLDDIRRKHERWERIIREAAEQSRRGRLPILEPATMFQQALERVRDAGGLTLLPWEDEIRTSLKRLLSSAPLPFSINLFIGPEGGFTEDEVRMAQAYGVRTVSLGPRILRAETAGIVAAAAILYEAGDLEPLPA